MSKSTLATKSSTRRHVILKGSQLPADMKEENQAKRKRKHKGAQTYGGTSSPGLDADEQKQVDLQRKTPAFGAPPALLEAQTLDWCECSVQGNRRCNPCAPPSIQQTDLNRQSWKSEPRNFPTANQANRDPSLGSHHCNSATFCDCQVRNLACSHDDQGYESIDFQHNGFWLQMQNLLASPEEIFPCTGSPHDDYSMIEWSMVPEVDQTPSLSSDW